MMAPISDSVTFSFSAWNTNGSEAGRRSRRKVSSGDAAYERISSSDVGSTDTIPLNAVTAIGAVVMMTTIATFDGLSLPKYRIISGASAMTGMAVTPFASGNRIVRAESIQTH